MHQFHQDPTQKRDAEQAPGKPEAQGRISKRLIIALNLAILMVLAGGVAAYGALSKTVTVDVDGKTEKVRTFGATVSSVLQSRDVDPAKADKINANLSDKVSDGETIKVRYDKDVTVAVDGKAARKTVPVATVGEALDAFNVEPAAGAFISGDRDTKLDDVDGAVVVSNPKDLAIKSGKETKKVNTAAPTAADALEEANIQLGSDDRVEGGANAWLSEGQTIEVQQVEYVHRVKEVQKKAPVEYREDDDLPKGERKVLEQGKPGVTKNTVLITKTNGDVSNELVITSKPVQKAETRIVARGTGDEDDDSDDAPDEDAPSVDDGSVWDRLAQCESGGNWAANSGNGYYGGVQFSPQTWRSLGAPGLPHENSREVQIKYAKILQQKAGWGQWPACAAKLGLL